jgi:uncharacterized protein (TIGR02996 family)
MPNLPAILDTIRAESDDERQWLALADWLWDSCREDEAAEWETVGHELYFVTEREHEWFGIR